MEVSGSSALVFYLTVTAAVLGSSEPVFHRGIQTLAGIIFETRAMHARSRKSVRWTGDVIIDGAYLLLTPWSIATHLCNIKLNTFSNKKFYLL